MGLDSRPGMTIKEIIADGESGTAMQAALMASLRIEHFSESVDPHVVEVQDLSPAQGRALMGEVTLGFMGEEGR